MSLGLQPDGPNFCRARSTKKNMRAGGDVMRIPGINVAEMARTHQTSSAGYSADDSWVNIMLEPGFRVWRGVGGRYTPYHIGSATTYDAGISGTTAAQFWQAAQVRASPTHGY